MIDRLDAVLVERMKDLATRLTTASRGLLSRMAFDTALVTNSLTFDYFALREHFAGAISSTAEREATHVGDITTTQCSGIANVKD